jgi:hypothetical protein
MDPIICRNPRPTARVGLVLAIHALSSCHQPPREEHSASVTGVDSIVLERTRCYGTCPAYRLRIAASGDVAFESRNPGDSGRTATDRLTPTAVQSLVAEASTLGFDTLPDVIASDKRFCPDEATDHPTATVTLFRKAGAKRVEDYHGCFARSDHSVVNIIEQLRRFERMIDSTAGSARWVRPADRR